MTIINTKKIIFLCIAVLATPFHFSSASAVYESFVPEISLNDACVPIITYSVVINPQTIVASNSFVLAFTKLNGQGAVVQSFDYPISVPANGAVNNVIIIANGFSGSATYTLQVIENGPTTSSLSQTEMIQLIPDMGTCSSAGGDQDKWKSQLKIRSM
jgi:hypothetical protein